MYFDKLELVAGTCFSFTDIVFIERRFDYCIVDEASQQHFLLTFVGLSRSDKFNLVGDDLQLKPLSFTKKSFTKIVTLVIKKQIIIIVFPFLKCLKKTSVN